LKDFLTFERFITPDILIFFYYLGVIFLPLLLWIYRDKVQSFLATHENKKLFLFLSIIFLILQLMWRMMFEAMIGYFDMHNYLQTLVKQIN